MKNYGHVTTAVFGVIAVVHAVRLFYGWEAIIGGWMVPLWVSGVVVVVAGALATWGCKEGCKDRGMV